MKKEKKVQIRDRTYTFKVECTLPSTALGESRKLTSFVYGAKTIADAKARWFDGYVAQARKNGLRGPKQKLLKKLPLVISRIANSAIGK